MRGPKPIPSALKVLRGNPGRRPLPVNEPKAPPAELTPPHVLSPVALGEWQRLAPILLASGLLTRLDPMALQMYCESFADWQAARAHVAEHGTVITNAKGILVASPYVVLAAKAWERMRRMLIEFGMTPSARARVKADDPPTADDPFAEFAQHGDRSKRRGA
jgi:P27 family predicted phage terminase small subunit